jgi:hypothetical protein
MDAALPLGTAETAPESAGGPVLSTDFARENNARRQQTKICDATRLVNYIDMIIKLFIIAYVDRSLEM